MKTGTERRVASLLGGFGAKTSAEDGECHSLERCFWRDARCGHGSELPSNSRFDRGMGSRNDAWFCLGAGAIGSDEAAKGGRGAARIVRLPPPEPLCAASALSGRRWSNRACWTSVPAGGHWFEPSTAHSPAEARRRYQRSFWKARKAGFRAPRADITPDCQPVSRRSSRIRNQTSMSIRRVLRAIANA
jgi:hypothetical protein